MYNKATKTLASSSAHEYANLCAHDISHDGFSNLLWVGFMSPPISSKNEIFVALWLLVVQLR